MNRAGSFLYEPAGSVHTLAVHRGRHAGVVPHVRREPEPRRRRQRRERRRRRGLARRSTSRCASRWGCPARTCWSTEWHRRPLRPRRATSTAPPHEVLAELRRTQPVYFQEMPGEPGYWVVLKHADLVHVAREPNLFSASEGGVDAREPRARAARDDARHAAGDGPAAPRRLPAADRAAFKARVIAGMEDRIRAICREIMARPRPKRRRRVRARRHVRAAVAGDRPAHGPARPRTCRSSTGWRR